LQLHSFPLMTISCPPTSPRLFFSERPSNELGRTHTPLLVCLHPSPPPPGQQAKAQRSPGCFAPDPHVFAERPQVHPEVSKVHTFGVMPSCGSSAGNLQIRQSA
jgi:hypothetical protein